MRELAYEVDDPFVPFVMSDDNDSDTDTAEEQENDGEDTGDSGNAHEIS